jgi:hypothetical protein
MYVHDLAGMEYSLNHLIFYIQNVAGRVFDTRSTYLASSSRQSKSEFQLHAYECWWQQARHHSPSEKHEIQNYESTLPRIIYLKECVHSAISLKQTAAINHERNTGKPSKGKSKFSGPACSCWLIALRG